MQHTNFWISSVSASDQSLCIAGRNRAHEKFEIRVTKYIPNGPVDFDNEDWDEGSFLVWDGDDLWQIESTLEEAASSHAPEETEIPDDEFPYHQYGLSPIVFSQITGTIVANL